MKMINTGITTVALVRQVDSPTATVVTVGVSTKSLHNTNTKCVATVELVMAVAGAVLPNARHASGQTTKLPGIMSATWSMMIRLLT
jgi:hypothetical protein